MNLKALLTAAALAIAPVMSYAATTADPSPTINGLLGSPYEFNITLDAGEAAGSLDFIFQNNTGASAVFALSEGTVEQLSATFTGGVTLEWLGSGESDSVAEGASGSEGGLGPIQTGVLGIGDTDTLRLSWGAVVDVPGDIGAGSGDIDFQVVAKLAPVPVPAGILLMGTALAGFGVMRRRKKAA